MIFGADAFFGVLGGSLEVSEALSVRFGARRCGAAETGGSVTLSLASDPCGPLSG